MNKRAVWTAFLLATALGGSLPAPAEDGAAYEGAFYRGRGDAAYLRLLDTAAGLFAPNPRLQNLSMLYMPAWNGLVEGPTWDAWWIQNSYGTTLAALPFLQEPFLTFLQNSQDLWFDQMGDGQRKGATPPFDWVAPDGCLCDAARPGWIVYRQGDGRVNIHDWGMEFTAAGIVMQAELLLISRDAAAVPRYLSRLERSANFIETRRDPTNNLFLAGPAGNLLAPSFAGWKRPDGTYGKAYLTGLSVTYIAALDRLIELEKFMGRADQAQLYTQRRDAAKKGLARLTTPEGYLIRSLDPDGTQHGVFGAPRHGYFEASPNHDAIALRVVDDKQAESIYAKIASIPGLRPHQFIIPNYPSYDDMYEAPAGLWGFGTWVNGGHWSTCEARMILAYYRLGRFEDARRSMLQLLTFAERFRMDNPLVKFGSDVYQPGQPVNLTYDAFGPPAAFVRGLFECLYLADGLRLIPHVPPGVEQVEQRFPIRFGARRLFLAAAGRGAVTAVRVNEKPLKSFDAQSLFIPADAPAGELRVAIGLGGAEPPPFGVPTAPVVARVPPPSDPWWDGSGVCDTPGGNGLPLRIGASTAGGNGFVGDIAVARVYRRALSEAEVARQAQRPPSDRPRDAALLAAYAPETVRGATAPNAAGTNLAAACHGDLTVAGAGTNAVFRFGGNGYLDVPSCRELALRADYTLEAWIRPGAVPPAGGRIMDRCTVGASDGPMVDWGCQGQMRFICESGVVAAPSPTATGVWHHVAATLDAQCELRLHLDGKLVARLQGTAPHAPARQNLARVGTFWKTLALSGQGDTYEAAHSRLVVDCVASIQERMRLKRSGALAPLPAASQQAADRLYLDTADKLALGLARVLDGYATSADAGKRRLNEVWRSCE